jgi:hypothetical protein
MALVGPAGGHGVAVGDPDEADPASKVARHLAEVGLLGLSGPAPGLEEAHHHRPPPQPSQADRAPVEGGHPQRRGRLAPGDRQQTRRRVPGLPFMAILARAIVVVAGALVAVCPPLSRAAVQAPAANTSKATNRGMDRRRMTDDATWPPGDTPNCLLGRHWILTRGRRA